MRPFVFHFQLLRDFGFPGAAHAKLAEQTRFQERETQASIDYAERTHRVRVEWSF